MNHLVNTKGFTLMEAIVVIAVLSILAGALVPLAIKNIDDSKISAAKADVKAIAAAITNLRYHTGKYPHLPDSGDYYTNHLYLIYSGKQFAPPTYGFSDTSGYTNTSRNDALFRHLIQNKPGATNHYDNWEGPYLASDKLDPWGRSYLVTVIGYAHCLSNYEWPYVWVISAGPDTRLDTSARVGGSHGAPDGQLAGDDIGLLIYQGSTQAPCRPE